MLTAERELSFPYLPADFPLLFHDFNPCGGVLGRKYPLVSIPVVVHGVLPKQCCILFIQDFQFFIKREEQVMGRGTDDPGIVVPQRIPFAGHRYGGVFHPKMLCLVFAPISAVVPDADFTIGGYVHFAGKHKTSFFRHRRIYRHPFPSSGIQINFHSFRHSGDFPFDFITRCPAASRQPHQCQGYPFYSLHNITLSIFICHIVLPAAHPISRPFRFRKQSVLPRR